jgi:3-hydroxyisobutyrate dehydrogenase
MKIGWIGVGTMGRPMVKNLRRAGWETHVFVRNPETAGEMAGLGCVVEPDIRTLAAAVDVLLLCLPNDAVVMEVVTEALTSMRAGTVLADHSTVSPYTSRSLAGHAARQGIAYVDAPLSGGPMGAEAGTLAIMAGGTPEAFARCRPVFESYGKTIIHLGDVGAGNIAKLVNQLIISVTELGIVEGFVLGTKMGVDPQALYQVVSSSTGDSHMLHRILPRQVFQGDFSPKFTIDLLLKDIVLVNEMGRHAGVRMLGGALAEQVFREAQAQELGGQDIAALVRPLEQLAGVAVRTAPGVGENENNNNS